MKEYTLYCYVMIMSGRKGRPLWAHSGKKEVATKFLAKDDKEGWDKGVELFENLKRERQSKTRFRESLEFHAVQGGGLPDVGINQ